MDIKVVTDNLQFPEGPVAMADGTVLVVEIRRKTLTRVFPDGKTEIVAEFKGGPNGAAIGPDGAVYVCNNGGFDWFQTPDGSWSTTGGMPPDYTSGSIDRVDLKTGKVTTLYVECDGRRLNGPNDLVFDTHGGFWFSDPGKGTRDWQQRGHLLYAKADGSMIKRPRDHMVTTNGVGLSPDQKTLYVAETLTGRLYTFEIVGPGELAPTGTDWNSNVMGPVPGGSMLDSLKVEANGNICVGTLRSGGITIFDLKGNMEFRKFPDTMVTNLCFGGPDMCEVWVTGSHAGELYKCRWPRPGLKLNYNA
jgi:gluconolactonase